MRISLSVWVIFTSLSTPLLSPLNFVSSVFSHCFFSSFPIKSNLCYTYILQLVAFHWGLVHLPGATLLRNNHYHHHNNTESSFARSCNIYLVRWDFVPASPLQERIWLDLSLHKTCACCPNHGVHLCSFPAVPGGHCFLVVLTQGSDSSSLSTSSSS